MGAAIFCGGIHGEEALATLLTLPGLGALQFTQNGVVEVHVHGRFFMKRAVEKSQAR